MDMPKRALFLAKIVLLLSKNKAACLTPNITIKYDLQTRLFSIGYR